MASEKIILKMTLWTIHISNFGANLKPAGHAHRATSTHFDSTPSELARAPCKRMPKPREHARWRHQSRIAVGAACHNTILLNQIEIPETAYFMERWLVLVRNGFLTPRIGRDTNVHHNGGVAPLLSSESNTVFKSRTKLQNDVLEQARRLLRQVLMQREWIPSDLVIVKNASFSTSSRDALEPK
jgi:hypothetical protein